MYSLNEPLPMIISED